MERINAKGLEYPKPVILIKKALESSDEAIIVVDNEVAKNNIKKFAENNNCQAVIIENSKGIELHLKKRQDELSRNKKEETEQQIALLIKSEEFGTGDPKLGAILMKSFLVSLLESNKKIKALMFMNSGVFLTTKEGEILEVLKEFTKKEIDILSCGTCLDFYSLKEELKIGEITNMYSTVDTLTESGIKVIVL